MCEVGFESELGTGCVDTVCDMSNWHVSHGHPMDVAQPAYTPSQIEGNFMFFLYSCVSFRSANCQAISTEANTTQVCHVWKTQRHRKGCD